MSPHARVFPRAGGAIHASGTKITIEGYTSIVHNSGYDGGEGSNKSLKSRLKHYSIYRIRVEAFVINEPKRNSREIRAISYWKADGLPGLGRSRTCSGHVAT